MQETYSGNSPRFPNVSQASWVACLLPLVRSSHRPDRRETKVGRRFRSRLNQRKRTIHTNASSRPANERKILFTPARHWEKQLQMGLVPSHRSLPLGDSKGIWIGRANGRSQPSNVNTLRQLLASGWPIHFYSSLRPLNLSLSSPFLVRVRLTDRKENRKPRRAGKARSSVQGLRLPRAKIQWACNRIVAIDDRHWTGLKLIRSRLLCLFATRFFKVRVPFPPLTQFKLKLKWSQILTFH